MAETKETGLASKAASAAANYAVKKAVGKAAVSGAAAVAPYVAAGCGIVLAIYLFISLTAGLAIFGLYYYCENTPSSARKAIEWWYGADVSVMCGIFKSNE